MLIFWGCSHRSLSPQLSDSSEHSDSWIYSPYDFCDESRELCASGEGKNLASADAQARASLASIFEVKVSSEFSSFTGSQQLYPWQSSISSDVQNSIKESIDEVLETVQIKKRKKQKSLTYSLASLDRNKASELMGNRITKLDQELESLWAKKSRTNLRKIFRLFSEREKLNERYSIVSGTGRSSIISFAEIISWRQTKPETEPIALKVGQAPDWLKEKIHELLSEAGFKIVKGDSRKAISLNMDSIKEFLNVSGFEKYTFTLSISSFVKGEKNKTISLSETVNGRNQVDALLRVKKIFIEYIEDHLSDLALD